MAVAYIPSIEQKENLHLELSISTTLGISASQAKRKLTGLLIDEVSLFVTPYAPLLIVTGEGKIFWRFPVYLVLGRRGELGQVGEVDVDAHSGDILITNEILEEFKANAERLAKRAALQPVN